MCTAQHQRGFIALISTIIISFVILTLVIAVSFSGFFGRVGILGSEINERSAALAEACVETAVLELFKDDTYPGGTYVRVGDTRGCYICPITGSGNLTVLTQASSSDAFTNIEVVTDPDTGAINSWEEVPTVIHDLDDGSCTTP